MESIFSLPKESVNVEYKSGFNSFAIGRVICAFLNTIGGKIYIGIHEDDIVGIDDKTVAAKMSYVLKNIYPDPGNRIETKKKIVGDKWILIIDVKQKEEYKRIYSFRDVVYYRIGTNNRIFSAKKQSEINDIIYNNKRNASNLPVLEEYSPSDTNKGENFNKEKKDHNVSYKRIGPPYQNRSTFYKYLDLDTVLMIFRENPKYKEDKDKKEKQFLQTMRFVEPPKWEDQFESRFYNANYKKVNKNPNNIPKLYATCFTPKEESEPAWMAYNKENDGLGKRCVQLRMNQIKLREELVKNLKNSNHCTIVEGQVQYMSKDTIRTLHLSTDKDDKHSEIYDEYFSDFTLANYINLLLLKRIAYEHEREVRIFLIYDDDRSGDKATSKDDYDFKDIELNWLSVLERIRVSPDCTKTEIDLLQDTINNLIDKSNVPDKNAIKEKLVIEKYNVNEDEDRGESIPIGETHEEFSKRHEAKRTKGSLKNQ